MSTVLDAPPARATDPGDAGPPGPPGHPVVRFVASLTQALDGMREVPAWSMTVAEQRETLVGLRAQRARLEELELRILVAADRNQVGADSGSTSTAAWLADATGTTRRECFRALALGQALDGAFEPTRRALANGAIDAERAGVIVHAVQALTAEHDDLPEGTSAAAQAHLLELAARFDARTLRMLGKRLYEVVCPAGAEEAEGKILAREEDRAARLAYLSVRENGDGTSEGRFRLPTLHAQLLTKALQTLTSPRRLGERRRDPVTGRALPHATLLGHGLMELLERHLNTDTLPATGGSPFTVVVTVTLDALRAGLGAAGVDTGHRISAGQARRLACRAGVIPMVLGGGSVPLDMGRERRLFTKHQRLALHHQYGGCAAINCDRPPSWTEVHHEHPWATGGRTDLRGGIPLCPSHHHMADHPETWHMRRLPTGAVRFRRRT